MVLLYKPLVLEKMQRPRERGIVRLLVATVPDRLHGAREFLSSVAATIGQALEKAGGADGDTCTVSYRELPILGSPFDCESPPRITEDDVRDYSRLSQTVGAYVSRRGHREILRERNAPPQILSHFI
jgi:hypothetical protein